MARRLSRKKISRWLLLIAAIVIFCTGTYRKAWRLVGSLCERMGGTELRGKRSPDVIVDSALVCRLGSFVERTRRAGSLGICVWDETARKEVYAYHADSLMRPASNMKILTCIAALRRLGPNYRFESSALLRGDVVGDTLKGDIGIRLGYDPWFDGDSLRRLAQGFSQRGIHFVDGKVIVEMAITEQMAHEEHCIIGDLKIRRLGLLYRGERRVVAELKYALRSQGIHIADSQLVVNPSVSPFNRQPADHILVAKTSTPMVRSVFRALQNSSNEHAECLGYALAAPFLDGQNHREAGTKYLRRFVEKQMGVVPDSVCVIHDPSGLCVHDRLSPRFLVRLLRFACAHEYIGDELRRGLPLSGLTGTLHDRMCGHGTRGKIQAKTGTLTREGGITSLSGYATGANGHLLLFSIIQNGMPVYDARIWQDKFCAQLLK